MHRTLISTHQCLTPACASEVFRAPGPSAVLWLPGAEADNDRFTADLVRTLPCYRLDLALEPARNSQAMAELLERLPAMIYPDESAYTLNWRNALM